MDYRGDRKGSKWLFLAIVIFGVYLAFFNFNVVDAYWYTVEQAGSTLNAMGL